MEKTNELSTEIIPMKKPVMSIFSNIQAFEDGQRMAQLLTKSNIVPLSYQNNLPNVIVALEIANRIGVSPFMVMQNLDIIQGKPSWSSTFIIAVLNSCGRFSQLRWRFDGEKDDYGCIAYATDISTGEVLESPKVDWKMVNAEGWSKKKGSKWLTMPKLMFHYRSASFFGRIYASDILKGMQSTDEVIDVVNSRVVPIEKDDDEEISRIKKFIEKATTLKELKKLQSQIGSVLFKKLEPEFIEKENKIRFNIALDAEVILNEDDLNKLNLKD